MTQTKRLLVTLVLVFSMGQTQAPAPARSQVVEAGIVASAVIDQLKAAATELASIADAIGSRWIQQLGQQVGIVASQLEAALGEHVSKPIKELDASLKSHVQRAQAALTRAKAFIDSTRGCLTQDVDELAQSAQAAITQLTSDTIPWTPDYPVISKLERVVGGLALGFRQGTGEQNVKLIGSNLADPRCSSPTLSLTSPRGVEQKLSVDASSPNSVTFKLPALDETGLFKLKLQTYKSRWFRFLRGCKKQPEITTTFNSLSELKFQFNYQLTASCRGTERREFSVGTFGIQNSSCTQVRTHIVSGQFTTEPNWRAVSARHQVTVGNTRCSAIGPNQQGYQLRPDGRTYDVSVSCPPRSGRTCILGNCSCSGGGTGYMFRLWITGERPTTLPPNTISNTVSEISRFNTAASATVPTQCPNPLNYTLAGTVTYADGSTNAIASETGNATNPVSSAAPDGSTLSWNPGNRQITATSPRDTCRGIY